MLGIRPKVASKMLLICKVAQYQIEMRACCRGFCWGHLNQSSTVPEDPLDRIRQLPVERQSSVGDIDGMTVIVERNQVHVFLYALDLVEESVQNFTRNSIPK